MSTEAIADDAAALTKSLRLEDLLINAGAVPLPVDLMPSIFAQVPPDESEVLPKASDSRSATDDHAQTPIQAASHAINHETIDSNVAHDAVGSSLQAARNAIHDSLRNDTDVNSQSADTQVSGTSGEAVPATHGLEGAPAVGGFGAREASSSAHASPLDHPDLAHVLPAQHSDQPTGAGADPFEHVVATITDAATNGPSLPEIAVSNVGADIAHGAQSIVGDVAADAGSTVHDLLSVPSIAPALQSVTSVTQASGISADAGSALHNLLSSVSSAPALEPAASVAQAAENATDAGSAVHDLVGAAPVAPALEPVAPVTQASVVAPAPAVVNAPVADAVTVPSLNGAGLDALAGLLQPPPATTDAAHAAASPVHASVDDTSISMPIGLDDLHHSDPSGSHAIHALLPAVGSGLI